MKNVIRIAYFEPDNTALINGPVRQLINHIRETFVMDKIFLAPHWKQGPHLDLVIECDSDLFRDTLFPLCKKVLQEWLSKNPSTTTLDPIAYKKLSQQLALTEIEPPPYLPLLTNNSVSQAEYKQNSTLKLQEFMTLKAEFLHETLPLLYRLHDIKAADKSQFYYVLSLLLAVCGTTYRQGGLSRGFNSFRSHAEFFLLQYDTSGKLRQHFDTVEKKYQARLRGSISEILAGNILDCDESVNVNSLLATWLPIAQKYHDKIATVVSTNYSFLASENIFIDNLKNIAEDIPQELHKGERKGPMAVALEHEEGQRMLKSEEFMSYRTMVNFFYFLLPVVNVSPIEKFCICNMTAAAVEGILDISWRDLMISGYAEARLEAGV